MTNPVRIAGWVRAGGADVARFGVARLAIEGFPGETIAVLKVRGEPLDDRFAAARLVDLHEVDTALVGRQPAGDDFGFPGLLCFREADGFSASTTAVSDRA